MILCILQYSQRISEHEVDTENDTNTMVEYTEYCILSIDVSNSHEHVRIRKGY